MKQRLRHTVEFRWQLRVRAAVDSEHIRGWYEGESLRTDGTDRTEHDGTVVDARIAATSLRYSTRDTSSKLLA